MINSNRLILSLITRNLFIRNSSTNKINQQQQQQQQQNVPTSINNYNNELDVENEKSKKFDISLIPKDARDNFVIQFNKQVPTYDQLFEYNIDKKYYNKIDRYISESRFLSPDFLIKLQKKYDLSITEFKNALRNKMEKFELKEQSYITRRHGILGPDLAAANFILSRGGRVRFYHEPNRWIIDLNEIPKTFDKKYRLISIDASDLSIIFEGLDNLILLNELTELNLSNNRLDDWCCDKIARLFRNSKALSYLNLNNNQFITHRGIEALYKINSLKTLVIKKTKASDYPFINLVILLFNEINPNCNIIYK